MFANYSQKDKNTNYIEFQFCNISIDEKIDKIVCIKNITFCNKMSLFIDFTNYENFYINYGIYFKDAVHGDLTEGELDPYGINYYSLDKTRKIIYHILKNKPVEYDKVLAFLNLALEKNGFYILGI